MEAGKVYRVPEPIFFIICSNTMGMFTPDVEKTTGKKGIFIADAVGKAITDKGMKRVALPGARFTMEESFYKKMCLPNAMALNP